MRVQKRLVKQQEMKKGTEEKLEILKRKISKMKRNWDELTKQQKSEDHAPIIKEPQRETQAKDDSRLLFFVYNFN